MRFDRIALRVLMSSVNFTFNGISHSVPRGITIAAALISLGHVSWRTTRFAEEQRGVFCGIGVCFDCLVTVNGKSDIRACMDEIQDGDVIVGGDYAG